MLKRLRDSYLSKSELGKVGFVFASFVVRFWTLVFGCTLYTLIGLSVVAIRDQNDRRAMGNLLQLGGEPSKREIFEKIPTYFEQGQSPEEVFFAILNMDPYFDFNSQSHSIRSKTFHECGASECRDQIILFEGLYGHCFRFDYDLDQRLEEVSWDEYCDLDYRGS